MSIVKLTPAFKDYLWGGTKLKENYGKKTDMDPVAESWELSVHPDGPSIVASGEYEGLSFPEYLEKKGKSVLGTKGNTFEFFPILIKFIDAKQPLSIQVHPDNEYALRVEHEYGKTEMWYILDCEPDSFLYFGVNKEITKEEFERRIHDNTLLDGLKAEFRFVRSNKTQIQHIVFMILVVLEKMVNLVNYIFKRRLMFQI